PHQGSAEAILVRYPGFDSVPFFSTLTMTEYITTIDHNDISDWPQAAVDVKTPYLQPRRSDLFGSRYLSNLPMRLRGARPLRPHNFGVYCERRGYAGQCACGAQLPAPQRGGQRWLRRESGQSVHRGEYVSHASPRHHVGRRSAQRVPRLVQPRP